ncbi:MAG: Ig-like domain-containing protein, partial [Solirubrobacterales bacterium]|nr:Ig-like domain-containing protein [Solirubrobacterales bacterium]
MSTEDLAWLARLCLRNRVLRLVLLSLTLSTFVSCGILVGAAEAATATSVKVTLAPSTIVADGQSKTEATASVTDAKGHPVSGDAVRFSSSDPGQPASIPATETAPGTYTATIVSTTTVGRSTITATDSTAKISGTATLTQTAGTPTTITVRLTPSTIVADGRSTTTAAAVVTDAQGHPISGQVVTFSSNDPGRPAAISGAETSPGTYTATIVSTTTVGRSTMTATDSTAKLVGTATLTQTAGPPATIRVTLTPATLAADGRSTTTAVALVNDAQGHAVSGQVVTFSSSDPRQPASIPAGEVSPGMYMAIITSTTTLGQSTITAADKAAGISASATLTQTVARAVHITLTVSPAAVVADGRSKSAATATITDAQGHPVPGDNVVFSASDGGVRFSP